MVVVAGLVVAILLPVIGGSLVAFSIKKNIPWYFEINKPSWAPPKWLFGPVWTVLYIMMGVGSYIAADVGISNKKYYMTAAAILVYFVNLSLNWAWSLIFFGMREIKIALIEIIMIDVTAIAATCLFFLINIIAGVLLLPYLIWLTIATFLNYSILRLNPELANDKTKENIENN